jgi:hypothetical protein
MWKNGDLTPALLFKGEGLYCDFVTKKGDTSVKKYVIARYEAISILYRANMHSYPAYVEIASYLAMTCRVKNLIEPPCYSPKFSVSLYIYQPGFFSSKKRKPGCLVKGKKAQKPTIWYRVI